MLAFCREFDKVTGTLEPMNTEGFRAAFTDWLQKSQDHLIKSDWRSVAKDYPFLSAPNRDIPYTAFNKKLKFCRVCLITGAALYLREKHQSFSVDAFEGDFTFRTIPKQIFTDDIEMCHEYADSKYSRQDINTTFPIVRLRELEQEELIGELAEVNYSIYDFIPQADRIGENLAPSLAKEIIKDEIDIAIFLPVCELGHQTMVMIQHEVERRGVATLLVASHPASLSRLIPPRAILVDCPDGSPLGEPNNAKKQREFLQTLFKFISTNHESGAVLKSGYKWVDPFA